MRLFRRLCAMPYCHNPNNLSFYAIEKTIWSDYNFSERKVRKFRQYPAGVREFLES